MRIELIEPRLDLRSRERATTVQALDCIDATMQIDDLAAARALMQTIDILRNHAFDAPRVLEAREGRLSLEDVFISVVEQARERGKISAED